VTMPGFEKVVVVTRKTRLAELVERFNTRAQAKFYIEHAGGDFAEYEREDAAYRRSLDVVRRAVEVGLRVQVLDRELVPSYVFLPTDVVVTLGQDGLVANTAKYAAGQPILGVNPESASQRPLCPYPQYARYDGTGDLRFGGNWSCAAP